MVTIIPNTENPLGVLSNRSMIALLNELNDTSLGIRIKACLGSCAKSEKYTFD